MSGPFRIAGPAIVSFSGGRTSAYMLRRILDAHGGALPADVHAVFANTGREMPATLDFVARCEAEWNVPITWLEFTARCKDGYRVVNHSSASRDGEPFAALIRAQPYLPNPVTRACTQELKIRTMRRWVMGDLGWSHWTSVVGLRADEMHRVRRLVARKHERFTAICPLADAGVTKADVMAFWAAQPFDLALRGPWEGNCDGCFLKSRAAIERMTLDYPDRMKWWAEQESAAMGRGLARSPENARFRADRPGYADIAAYVAARPRLMPDDVLAHTDSCGVWCGT